MARKDCPVGKRIKWKVTAVRVDGVSTAAIDETQRPIEAVLSDPTIGALEGVEKVLGDGGVVVGLTGYTRQLAAGDLDTTITLDADRGDGVRTLTGVVEMRGLDPEAEGTVVETGDPED